jgi:hypothetical protein
VRRLRIAIRIGLLASVGIGSVHGLCMRAACTSIGDVCGVRSCTRIVRFVPVYVPPAYACEVCWERADCRGFRTSYRRLRGPSLAVRSQPEVAAVRHVAIPVARQSCMRPRALFIADQRGVQVSGTALVSVRRAMGACVPRAVGFAVCLRATVHGTNKSKMLLGRLIGGAGWDIGSAADVVKALRLKSRR